MLLTSEVTTFNNVPVGEVTLNAEPLVMYIPLPMICTSDEVNSLVATIPASRSPSILSAVTVV